MCVEGKLYSSEDVADCLNKAAMKGNGDIVFKSQYGETLLQDGDNVEVVSFVGGG